MNGPIRAVIGVLRLGRVRHGERILAQDDTIKESAAGQVAGDGS
jgi:hypothetical protein